MHRKILTAIVIAGLAFGLAACGQEPGTRALSGGAIGAGTGAILGAAVGGGAGTGALIGGAVGALGGALTSPNTIDLGRPIIGN
ncbi:MAG: YMGG-like glycine zipper-containing protein [Acetobacteraceae bacterium]